MRKSLRLQRRLLFGLSVEDAQGKFDTPESRATLQLGHERYNKGVYHELQTAQRHLEKLSPSQKLHITRHTKPSVPGFQAYGKNAPEDYVVQELCWTRDTDAAAVGAEEPGAGLKLVAVTEVGLGEVVDPLQDSTSAATTATSSSHADGAETEGEPNSSLDEAGLAATEEEAVDGVTTAPEGSDPDAVAAPSPPPMTSNRLALFQEEQARYQQHREVVLATLEEALESMTEAVSDELLKKRQRHSLEGAGALFTGMGHGAAPAPAPAPASASRNSLTGAALYSSDLPGSAGEAFLQSTAYPRHPHQLPSTHANLVDRLVEEMVAAQESGYKPLSHHSSWFDPIQLRVVLNEDGAAGAGAEDEDEEEIAAALDAASSDEEREAILAQREQDRLDREAATRSMEEAFHSPYIAIPVASDNVSFSLYVAGGLMMNETLMQEFPYHVARFFVSPQSQAEAAAAAKAKGKKPKRRGKNAAPAPAPTIVPAAEVEVYFSAELYRIAKLTGMDGIRTLRLFIGRAMRAQHSPTSLSQSMLMNPLQGTSGTTIALPQPSSIRIPWRNLHPVAGSQQQGQTDVTQEESDGGFSMERKREAVHAVWRAWGHLVKDLHVHGDLDYLYVRIHQQQEKEETAAYIRGVQEWATTTEMRQHQQPEGEEGASVETGDPTGAAGTSTIQQRQQQQQQPQPPLWASEQGTKQPRILLPLPVDFTVVECVLEKRGLPHNMVIEDITETLRLLQSEGEAMVRLAVMDEWALQQQQQHQPDEASEEDGSKGSVAGSSRPTSKGGDLEADGGPQLLPVVYTPSVVVSHAGVVERGMAHTFQRIRIRGSQLAHVEALAKALKGGDHFTDRSGASIRPEDVELSEDELPPNLAFAPHRAAYAQSQYRLRSRSRRGRQVRSAWGGGGPAAIAAPPPLEDANALNATAVSEEEREFWKTHYYQLTDIKLVFYDRVEAADVMDESNPRHTSAVQLLLAGDAASGAGEEAATPSRRGKKKGKRARQKVKAFSLERVYAQLCMEVEKEAGAADLQPGDCPGYQYWMRLRKLRQEETPLVSAALKSLQQKGFINYFSPQRFSTFTVMDRHPGLALLQGNFRAAANIVVHQCFVDAALRSEQLRSRLPFSPQLTMSKPGRGYPVNLPDFPVRGPETRQSILARASPMVQVLNNALQATQLMQREFRRTATTAEEDRGDEGELLGEMEDDPCAEAFRHVLGQHPCKVLIHEFLAFLWNDLANQRLQRYGTFAVLPGDLVRVPVPLKDWLPSSTYVDVPLSGGHEHMLTYASKKDIAQQKIQWSDVVLPVPGADMLLPQNHTADLYVLTLKRFGIPFNPERRQWPLFDGPLTAEEQEHDPVGGASGSRGASRGRRETSASAAVGNALGLRIPAQYRSLLVDPSQPAYRFAAAVQPGLIGDPFQRWGESVRQVLSGAAVERLAAPPLHPFLWNGGDEAAAGEPKQPSPAPADPAALLPPSAVPSPATPAPAVLPFFTNKDTFKPKTQESSSSTPARRRRRAIALPAYPYWYPQHNDGALDIAVRLPTGVSPWMMVRELTKSDVAVSDVVQLQEDPEEEKAPARDRPHHTSRPESTAGEAETAAKRWRAQQRRRVMQARPVAISLALLHQHIFRSSGVRQSLLPTLRSYDSVSK
eukprot:gene5722-4083_t